MLLFRNDLGTGEIAHLNSVLLCHVGDKFGPSPESTESRFGAVVSFYLSLYGYRNEVSTILNAKHKKEELGDRWLR